MDIRQIEYKQYPKYPTEALEVVEAARGVDEAFAPGVLLFRPDSALDRLRTALAAFDEVPETRQIGDKMIIERVTCYDMRLSLAQINILAIFLDRYIPENAKLDIALPGEYRQRYSDQELDNLNQIRNAVYQIVHG